LPNTVSAEGATAEYKNGVLRVTLPKRDETKARRIEIKSEGAQTPKTIEAKADEAKAASVKA
jgi:HSP20 family protein